MINKNIDDKYLKWLDKIRLNINKINDNSIRNIYLELHNIYAEHYVLTLSSKKDK